MNTDFSRRQVLRMLVGSMGGLSVSGWLPRVAQAALAAKSAKACILLWMPGGPSQFETLDPKPGRENGGPTKAISTSVPGIELSENLPGVAKLAHDIAVVRSMKTIEGDHDRATRYLLTGYRPTGAPLEYPVLGSMVAQRLSRPECELPPFISVAPFRFADIGSGFLGPKFSPLVVSGSSSDPNTRANLTIENLTPIGGDVKKLADRASLLAALRSAEGAAPPMKKHEEVYG